MTWDRGLSDNCVYKFKFLKDSKKVEDGMYALEAAALAARERNMEATGQ